MRATGAGDLVVIGIASSGGKPSSVTDNKGDTYTLAVQTSMSGNYVSIYYAKTVPLGVTSVTAKFPYGNADLIASEYSGLDPSTPLDRTSKYLNGYGSGPNYTSGLTAQTTQPSELAWGFSANIYSASTTYTASAGWTGRASVGESFAQDQFLTTMGTYAATGTVQTNSRDYEIGSLLVTLRGGSSTAPPDTTPPTVSLTAPAPGSQLAKTVTISANAADNVAIGSVQFLVDGVLLSGATTAPYKVNWDTTTAADGPHTLTATAYDTSNNSTTSAPVSVTTNNSVPTISSFTATPAYVVSGGSTTLAWSVSNATSLQIGGIGSVTGTSLSLTPSKTTTYILTATNLAGSSTAQATVTVNTGVTIILDSDLAANVDDVGDHALLWALSKTGEANVLALITSSTNDYSAPAAYAIAKYYNHSDVPIGAYQGTSPNSYSTTNSYYTQQIANTFGKQGDTRANYPDSTAVYRQALASATDHSVYIVVGGFFEPLRSLLLSGPDSYSTLTGSALVAKKVAALVPSAGWYPDSSPSASFNFSATPDAASYVFANWPTPVIAFGTDVGGDVLTGPSASADPATNPIKDAYNLYCSNGQWCPNMQYGWTQVAILYAIRGLGSNFYFEGTNGTLTVWDSSQPIPGRDYWSSTPVGMASYARKATSAATLGNIINGLIQAAP
ncbi:MAG: hypothetical protein KGN84_16295 [Acidobacteriota bacterium]|nr:hypothetical protein [Acidobacteriota bacterium]